MTIQTRVAVLGGGVSGLCAGYYLSKALGPDSVIILEADGVVGGTTRSDEVDGFLLDWGPNGFLNREPLTLQWVSDLGLSSELVTANESAARRFIIRNEQLHEIKPPPAFLLSPLLSVPGRMRLLCEPFVPQKKGDAPETIWDFAARRIGREAADTLVGPMVSGVFGGDARQLSLAHCFPRMAAMERDYGGLFKALIAKRRENSGASPMGPSGVLTTFKQAIGFLPKAAADLMGSSVRVGARVRTLEKPASGFRLALDSGDSVEAEFVVCALPAFTAATVMKGLDEALAKTLDGVAYANIAVVCAAYRRGQVRHDLNGFGFLIPRTQKKRTLGCLWTSSIFPHQAPKEMVLLRTMFGGYTDPDAADLSDSDLLDTFKREVGPLLGVEGEPGLVRIYRHHRGIPQYLLHHGETLAAVEAAEDRHRGLVFAGNAFRGVGLNDCVVSAHRAVDRILN